MVFGERDLGQMTRINGLDEILEYVNTLPLSRMVAIPLPYHFKSWFDKTGDHWLNL